MSSAPKLPGLLLPPAANPMPTTSRYRDVGVAERVDAQGRVVRYLRRRIIRTPVADETARTVEVPPHVRVDQLADALLDDPKAWWKLADANAVRTAAALEVPGFVLRLPDEDR